jgi:hypothetical protein
MGKPPKSIWVARASATVEPNRPEAAQWVLDGLPTVGVSVISRRANIVLDTVRPSVETTVERRQRGFVNERGFIENTPSAFADVTAI